MFTATLYRPGQPAQLLTASQLDSLGLHLAAQPANSDWLTDSGLCLYADEQAAAALLGVHAVDLLASIETAAVYGLTDASDYGSQDNPAAEAHVEGLFDICELCGPVLVVEALPVPVESSPWVDGLTFLDEQHEPSSDRWFQLLSGPGGFYIHHGKTGAEPSQQHGPYSADELKDGRFGATVLALN